MLKRENCANHIACHGVALLSAFMIGGGLTSAVYGQDVPATPAITITTTSVNYDSPLVPRAADLVLSGTLSGATLPTSQMITILAEKNGVTTTLSDQVVVGADGAFSYTYNKATLDDSAPISITAQWGEVSSAASTINYPAPGNAVTIGDKKRKALVVIWDGCRGDVAAMEELTPNLHAYARLGAYSFKAFTGGIKDDPVTRSDTSTAAGFHNIWTGVFPNKHNVTGNSAYNPNYTTYPTFFKQLKTLSDHKLYMVGYFGWIQMYNDWLVKEDNFIDYIQVVAKIETADSYRYHNEAITMLSTNDALDLFFYECAEPDGQGHGTGFSHTNPNYTNKIKALDVQLKELIDAVRLRPTFNSEEWILILTSDHGGIGRGHGGQSEEERNIPFVVTPISVEGASPFVTPYFTEQGPANCAVHPTLLAHFGYNEASAVAHLEAKPFGVISQVVQAPDYFSAPVTNVATRQATLTWLVPTSYANGVPWTITISNDVTNTIITLDADEVQKGSITLNLPLSYTTIYTMTSSTTNDAGLPVTKKDVVTVNSPMPDMPSSLVRDLYCYLTMEDSFTDISTRNTDITPNDATKALFVDGPQGAGKAANFDSNWWVDVGCPTEVKSGSFSVSLWLYVSSSCLKDTSLFGTLNFADPNVQTGFAGVNNYDGYPALTWNSGYTIGTRTDVGDIYQKDTWDYVTYVFNRNADRDTVTAYRNGEKVFIKLFVGENQKINFAPHNAFLFGSSGPALDPGSSLQDEICVWKRALTDDEAKSLYHDYKGALPSAITVNGIVPNVGDKTLTFTIDKMIDRATTGTGVQTYGICYGAEDNGKTSTGWDYTSTFTFPASASVTTFTTAALPTGMAYYRLYITNDRGTTYTQAYSTTPFDFTNGLTHYLPMNGTVQNTAPVTTLANAPVVAVIGTPAYYTDPTEREWTEQIDAASFSRDWRINLGKPQAVIDGSFTLSCWINIPTTGEGDKAYISTQNWDGRGNPGFSLVKNGNHQLIFVCATDVAHYINIDDHLKFDTWTYISYVFDKTGNRIKGYVDGKEIFSVLYYNDSTKGTLAANNLLMGSDGLDNDSQYWSTSRIDEFALWDRALSPTEVFALYNDYSGVLASSPFASGCSVTNEQLTFTGRLESRMGAGANATYGVVYGDQDQGSTFDAWADKIVIGALPAGIRTLEYQSSFPLGTQKTFRWFIQDATTGQISFSSPGRTSLRDDVVLYLDGDKNATNTATGTNKITNLTIDGTGTPLYVTAPAGQGSAFDLGDGEWWINAKQPHCVNKGDFTIGLWFNKQRKMGECSYFGTQDWTKGHYRGFGVHENGMLATSWGAEIDRQDFFFYTATIGMWQYLTIVVDRSANTMTLYQNGRLVSQSVEKPGNPIQLKRIHPVSTDTYIAEGMNLLFGHSGHKRLVSDSYQDEIALWDRALSSTEISTLYTDYEGVLANIIPEVPTVQAVSQDPSSSGALVFEGLYRGAEQNVSYGIAYTTTTPAGRVETFDKQVNLGTVSGIANLQYVSLVLEDQGVSYAWYYTTASDATKVYSSIYTYTPRTGVSLRDNLVLYMSGDGSIDNKVLATTLDRVVPAIGGTVESEAYVSAPTGRGRALDLSRSDWWVNAGVPACMNTGSFTLGLWLNIQSLSGGYCLFGTQNWNSGTNLGFSIHEHGLSSAWGGPSQDPPNRINVYPYYTKTKNLWQYLTIVVDRTTNTMVLYKDGAFFSTRSHRPDTLAIDAPYIDTAKEMALLFGRSGTGGNYPSKSYQDEIALWSRALSAEEVSALYTTYGGVLVEPQPYTLSIDNGATVSPEALTYLQGILRETGADPTKNHTISAIDARKVYAFTLLPIIDDVSGRITAPQYHFKIVDFILTTKEAGIFADATIEVAYTHAPVGADAPQLASGCTIGLFANTAIDAATYDQVGGVATAINPVDGRATIRDVPLNGKTFFKARVLPPSN